MERKPSLILPLVPLEATTERTPDRVRVVLTGASDRLSAIAHALHERGQTVALTIEEPPRLVMPPEAYKVWQDMHVGIGAVPPKLRVQCPMLAKNARKRRRKQDRK